MRRIVVTLLLATASLAAAGTVYVDAVHGDNARDGQTARTTWRTLGRLAKARLMPRTEIRLHAVLVWREGRRVTGSGTPSAPIVYRDGGGA